MNTLPYREAFERVRAEFLERPGMRLTAKEVKRWSGVDPGVYKNVLDDLVRAKFLAVLPNGGYRRLSDTSLPASSSIGAERQNVPGGRVRRAS